MSLGSGWRARFALVAAFFWCLHMVVVFYFVAPSSLFSQVPIDGFDYDTHIAQTLRVTEGLERWGATWVYDVRLLAGQPEGTIFDADNKGWELWTYVLWKLGWSQGQAFNSFVLAAHALVPVAVGLCAYCWGLGAWASLLAAVLASWAWFFDSWLHWGWCIGMVAYVSCSACSLLLLGIFYRFTTERRLWLGVLFVPGLALCHLLHPYSFFILAVPLGAQYLRARRSLPLRGHVLVALSVIATVLLNGVWLLPALRHWHYIQDSAFFGQTGLGHLVADFFNVALDYSDSGVVGTRAGLRIVCLVMSVAALVVVFRQRLPHRVIFAAALASLFALGYLGSYLPGGPQIQPYRHVMPLTLLACIGAADFVRYLVVSSALAELRPALVTLLAMLAIGLVQRLAGDALYFLPGLLPRIAPLIDGSEPPLEANGYPHMDAIYRIPSPLDDVARRREVASWIAQNLPSGARVLIEDPHLGEHVAWSCDVEVLGGFRYRNIAHAYANFYRGYEKRLVDKATLEDYLRTYAVEWVITDYRRKDFEQARGLLELKGQLEKRYVYRTRIPVSKALTAGGEVDGSTNRIIVRGSRGDEPALLSYHFHEQLVCEPSCQVERAPTPFDAVGLIRIPAPHPENMTLWLQY